MRGKIKSPLVVGHVVRVSMLDFVVPLSLLNPVGVLVWGPVKVSVERSVRDILCNALLAGIE
jgi:hypothetical protein